MSAHYAGGSINQDRLAATRHQWVSGQIGPI